MSISPLKNVRVCFFCFKAKMSLWASPLHCLSHLATKGNNPLTMRFGHHHFKNPLTFTLFDGITWIYVLNTELKRILTFYVLMQIGFFLTCSFSAAHLLPVNSRAPISSVPLEFFPMYCHLFMQIK